MNLVVAIGVLVTVATAIPVFTEMRKHPKGLHILFFAEMWERFSYYGMRGLLIFYLTQHFLFDDAFSSAQYGAYTALVYLLPLVGGFLADKYLGNRKAIAFGALLLVAGHFTMGIEGEEAREALVYDGAQYELVTEGRGASRTVQVEIDGSAYDFTAQQDGSLVIEGLPASASVPPTLAAGSFDTEVVERDRTYVNIFYLALALIIMGVGFLKANISSIVGQLYEENDPRRDGGFTLYYYGINLGSFWAAILCGLLGETVGWWAGFGLAGVGMLLGWLVFVRGRALFFLPGKNLIDHVGNPPEPEKLKQKALGPLNVENLIYVLAILGVGVVWFMVQAHTVTIGSFDLLGLLLIVGGLGFTGYMIYYMVTKCTIVEAQRLILAIFLIVTSVVFWALFEQAGSSMNLFAARNTNLDVSAADIVQLGPIAIEMTLTASQIQSFNAGFILIFAPIFAALWAFLAKLQRNPNTVLKFGLALVQVGLGFMLLVWGVNFADDSYRVPLIFLAGAYLLHTTGELCLSPVGLSAITKLSPGAVVSFMMAGWFLSSAFAQYVAGIISAFTATDTVAGQVLDPQAALNGYAQVFQAIGVFAIGLGVVVGLLSFFLKKLGHGRAEDQAVIAGAAEAAGPDQDAHPKA
ncbi:oligopeptide:H+ symporter [Maricaulis sp.]|uniref:peptide MFS transporter n=1 Tax=Maricaulis sp. TaxID=1486257 RepID=UPI001B23BC0C|nr:MFS transporter [Maricaulis sp.]MBO6847761.1 MFS transporter [Maricaulis sp.]MBO6877384.1 MFS transporter [Maricaulis sp.]